MIDASIALGVKPPQIESPMNALAKVLQVREAQQGQQINALKMDEYQRGIESQNRLRQLLGGFGSDHGANQQKLMQGGYMKEAQDYGKNQADIAKTTGDAQYKQIETAHKKIDLMGQAFGFVKDNPSAESALQATDYLVQNGIMTPEQAQATKAKIAADPSPETIRNLAMQAYQNALSTKDQLPKLQTFNAGNRQVNQSVNPITGKATETGSTVIAQSPDSQASERSAAAGRAVTMRGQNMTDSRGRELLGVRQQEIGLKQAGVNKPLPVGALKMRVEAQDAADTADGVNQRLSNVEKRMTDGKLSFGPVSNLMSAGLNATGMSTENSRNFASFKSEMEKLRNDSLRLNKGVQTDGDAQRAWNELFQNINDTKLVKQRLSEIKEINARAKSLRLMEVDTIDRNYGRGAEPTQRSVLDEADAILNGG